MYAKLYVIVIAAFIHLIPSSGESIAGQEHQEYCFEYITTRTPRDTGELYARNESLAFVTMFTAVGKINIESSVYNEEDRTHHLAGKVELHAVISQGKAVAFDGEHWHRVYSFEVKVSPDRTGHQDLVLRSGDDNEVSHNARVVSIIYQTIRPLSLNPSADLDGARETLSSGDIRTHIDTSHTPKRRDGRPQVGENHACHGWISRPGEFLPREVYRFEEINVHEAPLPVTIHINFYAKKV